MYKEKLRAEIANFKQREHLYAAKRKELLEIELTYRKNQEWGIRT